MESYTTKRGLRLLKITMHYENTRSIKMVAKAFLSKEEREIFL